MRTRTFLPLRRDIGSGSVAGRKLRETLVHELLQPFQIGSGVHVARETKNAVPL